MRSVEQSIQALSRAVQSEARAEAVRALLVLGVNEELPEPVLQNIGVVKPEPGYLQGLRDACDRHGTVREPASALAARRLATPTPSRPD